MYLDCNGFDGVHSEVGWLGNPMATLALHVKCANKVFLSPTPLSHSSTLNRSGFETAGLPDRFTLLMIKVLLPKSIV